MRPPRALVARGKPRPRPSSGKHLVEDLLARHAVNPCDVEVAQCSSQCHGIPPIGTRGEVDGKDVLELE